MIISRPHEAFYYGQTLEEFVSVCISLFLIILVLSFVFSAARKFLPKQYKRIVFTTLYISILPLLDFIFIATFDVPITGFSKFIYPIVTLAYIPVLILISFGFKYPIEKHGDRIIGVLSFVCILILYYAVPRSFSKITIENEFVPQNGPSAPVHLIIFDGMSYGALSEPDIRHLFPNLNRSFANDSFVFEDAYSPGAWTRDSIPKLITGIEYDRYREEDLQLLIARCEDQDFQRLPTDSSLFQISKSYGYNNVLIGAYFPYCNLFGSDLTY